MGNSFLGLSRLVLPPVARAYFPDTPLWCEAKEKIESFYVVIAKEPKATVAISQCHCEQAEGFDIPKRHCEEQSDAAIPFLLRLAPTPVVGVIARPKATAAILHFTSRISYAIIPHYEKTNPNKSRSENQIIC